MLLNYVLSTAVAVGMNIFHFIIYSQIFTYFTHRFSAQKFDGFFTHKYKVVSRYKFSYRVVVLEPEAEKREFEKKDISPTSTE